MTKTWRFVFTFFKMFPLLLITSIALNLFVGFLEMLSTLSLAPVIDYMLPMGNTGMSVVTQKFSDVITLLGIPSSKMNVILIFVTLIFFQRILLVVSRWVIVKTKYAVMKELMLRTFKSFFQARWHFFSSTNRGVMLNTFNREMNLVGDAVMAMGLMFSEFFRLIFYFLIPFYISWKVTLIAAGLGLTFATPLLFLSNIGYRFGKKSTSTSNEYVDVIQESFSGAKVILGFANQKKSYVALSESFDRYRTPAIGALVLREAIARMYEPFIWITVLLTIYIAQEFFAVPIAEVGLIGYALFRALPLIGSIVDKKNSLANMLPSYEQIKNITQSATDQIQPTGKKPFTELKHAIVLEGVTFAYPNHEPILKNIYLTIPKGKMIAIAGESGVGKSSIIDMVMGFYGPSEGSVLVDGAPLYEYDIQMFRSKIGYVPQDSVLFNTSIKQNLLWSCDEATEAQMIAACQIAHAHDFILEMPDQYGTVVGDRGVRLSGGQKQRIALARAILRKPQLLILDEATSALDSLSEKLIQQAIEQIAKNTTIVIVAHRLSTITNADFIYLIENETIVESGTHDQLLQKKASYFTLHGKS